MAYSMPMGQFYGLLNLSIASRPHWAAIDARGYRRFAQRRRLVARWLEEADGRLICAWREERA